MYRCGQSLQGIMYIAFFVCFDAVLSLCFVKYDLSLCAGLCLYIYIYIPNYFFQWIFIMFYTLFLLIFFT
jgi:hypothetical protein